MTAQQRNEAQAFVSTGGWRPFDSGCAAGPAAADHGLWMELSDLREALGSGMIETRYQPIVRLADRRLMAVEALARLKHPTLGCVPPSDFVPRAESAGLAPLLTDLVARRALADMTGTLAGAGLMGITLNFPLNVLILPEAVQRLEHRRREARLPATRVTIELTESQAVEDLPLLRAAVERLRADGYGVAIDDISPSTPRLDELLQLPFTTVKLDRKVVQTLHRVPAIAEHLRKTVEVARRRGLVVVAEGVEDAATWHRVAASGIDQAQGFLIARPLPAVAVPVWLEAWQARADFE